jgi:hypothetical protein
MPSRETGQSRVPEPPARSTGVIWGKDIKTASLPGVGAPNWRFGDVRLNA